MGITNATDIIIHTNYSDISFILNVISASVVFILIWQVIILRKQNSLAFNPLMSLRFYRNQMTGEPFILIENVGHGTALDVDLKIFEDITNNELLSFKAFALKKDESSRTGVSFRKYPQVRVTGTYRNVRNDLISIKDRLFDFEYLGRAP